MQGSTYVPNFKKTWLIPLKIRIDVDALDGYREIEVRYGEEGSATSAVLSKKLNISIQDVRADFEISVKNYVPATNILTFEILNTAKSDVKALTLEIPSQENIVIKGSNRNIIGDLDSNDYTTADFEVTPSEGDITLNIIYTDTIDVRRSLNKTVYFNPSYFENRNTGQQGTSIWVYIIILVVVAVVGYWWYKRRQRKKEQHRRLHGH